MREAWAQLPPEIRRVCDRLVDAPAAPLDTLRDRVRTHLRHIEQAPGDLIDRPLARQLAERLTRLLDEIPPDQLRAVQLAVDYFVSDEDAEADLDSPLGLEDDAEVLNAVARHLSRPDLVIEL